MSGLAFDSIIFGICGLHTPPALAWFLAGCPVGGPSMIM